MNDRLQKILRLALNGAAAEGEWHAAAVRFVAILRSEGVEASAVSVRAAVPVSGPLPGPWQEWQESSWTDFYPPPPPRPKAPPPQRPEGAPSHVLLKSGRFVGKYLAELTLTNLQALLRDTPNQRLRDLIKSEINWRVKTRQTRPQ